MLYCASSYALLTSDEYNNKRFTYLLKLQKEMMWTQEGKDGHVPQCLVQRLHWPSRSSVVLCFMVLSQQWARYLPCPPVSSKKYCVQALKWRLTEHFISSLYDVVGLIALLRRKAVQAAAEKLQATDRQFVPLWSDGRPVNIQKLVPGTTQGSPSHLWLLRSAARVTVVYSNNNQCVAYTCTACHIVL